jgi:glycine/D-amino acid oxidase-like deaminating enzyme
MKDSYDVVVVGAGIVGAAIAYNLTQTGIQDVLVLEKNTVCSGDTAYSCAIVRTHYSNPLTCKMATIGRDVLADFPQRVGGESGFRRCGYLIFSGPDTLVEFERNVNLQRDAGAEVDLIDTRQMMELHPLLDPTRIAGAAFEPLSGFADPHLTTMAYVDAARRCGAEIRQGTMVRSLVEDAEDRVSGVRTDRGDISAGQVVLASGVWTNSLTEAIGLHYAYQTVNHKVVHFSFDHPYSDERYPVVRDLPGVCYNRPHNGGVLFGDSGRGEPVPNADHVDQSLARDEAGRFLENFKNCFPSLGGARITSQWAGRYDVSPDSNPIIGGFPGKDGVIAVCGLSGGGFKLAPCIGQMVAEQIAHGESRILPCEPYLPTRFEQDRGFRTAYPGTGAMA